MKKKKITENSPKNEGKHFKHDRKNLIITIISISVIVLIIFLLIWQYLSMRQPPIQYEFKDENVSTNISNADDSDDIIGVQILEPQYNDEIVDVSDFPDKINNYDVVGKIVIDKINITSYILGETSDDSLKYGVTKFYGPEINTYGNYCITGHNYKKVFGPLYNLHVGDTFYLVGKDGRKVTYEITEILPSVKADDMSHIEQNTDNKRKVTLITCTMSGITRYLVKAEEKI